jgi:hypothetical protein
MHCVADAVVAGVDEDDIRPAEGFFVAIGDYQAFVTHGAEPGSAAIQGEGAGFAREGVGHESRAGVQIHDLDLLERSNARGFQQGCIDLGAAVIAKLALGDTDAVNFTVNESTQHIAETTQPIAIKDPPGGVSPGE